MADTQTTVALNIGSQQIGMAVFEMSKSGALVLKGYETESIIADPAMDGSREAKVRAAIEGLAGRLKVPKAKVRYAIPSQTVFLRFVKLPPIEDDNIEQLVTFEAQQHVPFPLNEVVWDYELVEGETDKEVVIVAIKGDALEEINDNVNASGLSTAEVDVAPMALFNAYRATYGTPEEPTLIIDIGARTSDLFYIEGKRFFTRSVAIGGSSISAAIAKEYNISLADAEHQKVTNGLVALGGGHTETMDESVAALAMVIRNALTRLPAEISRTTNYYRSQHGGKAPTRVLLAGGGANLPYTLEFFQEKLNLPVEYFNPLQQVAIGKGVNTELLQREAHTMGELVGLGLRGIGKSTINIDLVPAAVELTRAADRRKPFFIAAAAVLIAGFAINTFFQFRAASVAEDKTRTMTETHETLAPLETQVRGLLKAEEQLGQVAKSYTDIESDHAYWFGLISELGGAFASDAVWMTEMTPLYGYNPLPDKDSPGPGAKQVVKTALGSIQGNASAIDTPVVEEDPQPQRGRRGQVEENKPEIAANAVLVKGYWRENPRSQNVVSELLKNLRENTEYFSFTAVNEQGKEVNISDDRILKVNLTGDEGDLGFGFELTLPLATPVAAK